MLEREVISDLWPVEAELEGGVEPARRRPAVECRVTVVGPDLESKGGTAAAKFVEARTLHLSLYGPSKV